MLIESYYHSLVFDGLIFDIPSNKREWRYLSYEAVLPESFIEENRDKVNWEHICHYQKLSEEFIAIDLGISMNHLAAILGKSIEDELLDQIFNAFCIGK